MINASQKENKLLKQINKHITVDTLYSFFVSFPGEPNPFSLFANDIFSNTTQIETCDTLSYDNFVCRFFPASKLSGWKPKGHCGFIFQNDKISKMEHSLIRASQNTQK